MRTAKTLIRSDWADDQADLSLRWAHTHFVGFVISLLTFFKVYPLPMEYCVQLNFEFEYLFNVVVTKCTTPVYN